ncbi:CMRF35-like molecule 1 [Talpa occidentalis]|uniref:CMRF35-like molecule 1 n=1 Tax=Talpa occidentalis TaxID=50954 RepID=UPI0023F8BC2A|nr:CMRF35-like molecule 1 [Talpa occidentalis]
MDVCFPGSSAVRGPGTVKGLEKGSLTVRCDYGQSYETHRKWWCRGADWGSCKTLVRTTGSEQEVKNGRVSIRDNQQNHTITVTMEALTRGDADTYWCGVDIEARTDLGTQVKVTVDLVPVTPEEDKGSQTVPDSRDVVTEILLPLVAAVLLLVLTAASLLAWRLVRRQRKASGISPGQGPSQKEDITYAALSLGALGQEPTYGNMEPTYSNTERLITHIPHRSQEEPTEYGTVRRH